MTALPRFPRICPSCGTGCLPTQKFCGECGTALVRGSQERREGEDGISDAAYPEDVLKGERKQVTVLFADIKGSLEILAERDPEDANRLLDNSLNRMMDAVHQYQGTVSQARGDGIMALFGAPHALEDHAVRACLAALRIQTLIRAYSEEAMRTDGVDIKVRVGVNSGEVVVRAMRNDIYTEYSAVGRTTHLAARMEQIARPDTILATAATARLVEGYVEVADRGLHEIKGLPERERVFEVLRAGDVRTRLQLEASRGLSPFVGREADLRFLSHAFEHALEGTGQVASLYGEPGVGKSRLVREALVSMRGAGARTACVSCSGFGDTAPYRPIVELLLDLLGVEAATPAADIRAQVGRAIEQQGIGGRDELSPALALLGALPAEDAFHGLDAAQRRVATIAAVTALIGGLAAQAPAVLVVEDLQWADTSTLAVLDELALACASHRLLLVLTYRPQFVNPWTRLAHHHSHRLEPLSADNAARLLGLLLGEAQQMHPLRRTLQERSAGNPFFLEQLVRALADGGALAGSAGNFLPVQDGAEVPVPATVHSVIASRIDRLATDQKRVLQVASVIGRTAALSDLSAMSGFEPSELRSVLRYLEAGDFLFESRLYPTQEFTFRHALTHEVVYEGMLRDMRRELHARFVGVLEASASAEGEEALAERIAMHATIGQLWPKAFHHARVAGNRAADRQAFREAVGMFDRALLAARHLAPGADLVRAAIDVRFELRNALQPLGQRDRIGDLLVEADAMALELGDRRRHGWAKSYLADHYWIRGQAAPAEAAGEEALRVAREVDDLALAVVTRLPLGLLAHSRGRYRRAMQHFAWVAENADGEHRDRNFGLFVLPSVFARSFQAWSLAELGDFAAATALAREALDIAEEARHAISRGYALLGIGVVHLRHGNAWAAIGAFERALAIETFAASAVGVNFVTLHLGYALSLGGRVDEGLAMLEEGVAMAEKNHFMARHALRLAYLGDVYSRLGETGRAVEVVNHALEVGISQAEDANETFARVVLGWVTLRGGDSESAAEIFADAFDRAVAQDLKVMELQCLHGQALALVRAGMDAQAARVAQAAVELATRLGIELADDTFG